MYMLSLHSRTAHKKYKMRKEKKRCKKNPTKKNCFKTSPTKYLLYQISKVVYLVYQLMPIVLANITIIICSGNAGKVVLLSYVALSIIYLTTLLTQYTYLPKKSGASRLPIKDSLKLLITMTNDCAKVVRAIFH